MQITIPIIVNRRRLEPFIDLIDPLVKLQNRRNIPTSITVIRGRPNRDQILIEHLLVALHNQLMRSHHCPQSIPPHKSLKNIRAKEKPSPSGRLLPALNLIRIRPHDITDESLMGNLSDSLNKSQVIQVLHLGTDSSMNTENLIIDNAGQSEIVEKVSAYSPDVQRAEFSGTLVIESVNLSYVSGLVVSSQKGNSLRVFDFEAN